MSHRDSPGACHVPGHRYRERHGNTALLQQKDAESEWCVCSRMLWGEGLSRSPSPLGSDVHMSFPD